MEEIIYDSYVTLIDDFFWEKRGNINAYIKNLIRSRKKHKNIIIAAYEEVTGKSFKFGKSRKFRSFYRY